MKIKLKNYLIQMDSTNDIIKESNYILREIKQIRGKKNISKENIEIIEDLAEIHEIKDLKQKPKSNSILEQSNIPNKKTALEVRLEGNSNDINDEEEIEEPILENENINNIIEGIFTKIENNANFSEDEELLINFKNLNNDEKNEVIEGIKIKINNEEQENKFNDLLKILS